MDSQDFSLHGFLPGWNEKRIIDGKSFDELFNLDGIPLWWFYKRIVIPEVIPRQLNPYVTKNKLKLIFYSKIFPKYVLSSERKKFKSSKRKNSFSSSEKVLFLAFTNHIMEDGTLFRIKDIVSKIKSDKIINELVLCADPLSSKNKKVDYNYLHSYYDEFISKKVKPMAKELAKKWLKLDTETKRKLFESNQSSLWDTFKPALNAFFSKEFIYLIILYQKLFEKIITTENIQVIVITSQNSIFEKCLLAAANKFKIPAVLVQHGTLDEPKVNPELLFNTKLAVFSPARKEGLIKIGVNPEDIIVTGPVIFDEIIKYKNQERNHGYFKIVIATSPTIESSQMNAGEYWHDFEKILKEVSKLTHASITIKLHPREKGFDKYIQLIEKNGFKHMDITKEQSRSGFYRLLSESDVFVHLNSSAVLEAMILDLPTVTLEITNGFKESITAESEAAIEVTQKDDMAAAIIEALIKDDQLREKRRNYVEKMCGKVDGLAHQRVVEVIYSLIQK